MNTSTLSDYQLLAAWRALDAEVRRRKVKSALPTGTVSTEATNLVIPSADVVRAEYFRSPTIHASPLAMAAYIGQKAGCVGPALNAHIVGALDAAAAGNLHQSLGLAGVDEADIKAAKSEIAKGCAKVGAIRTSVDWK